MGLTVFGFKIPVKLKSHLNPLRMSNPTNSQRKMTKILLYGNKEEIPVQVQDYLKSIKGFNPHLFPPLVVDKNLPLLNQRIGISHLIKFE